MKRGRLYHKRTEYIDDEKTSLKRLIILRFPPLIIGLVLGFVLTFVTSHFEDVLAEHVEVVFFIPFLVYLSDAVGTQTQNIYIRDLRSGNANFKKYAVKESLIGLGLSVIFTIISSIVIFFWFHSIDLILTVGLSMMITVTIAPIISLLITQYFRLEHEDPAIGAGPLSTVVQDAVTILIYGFIASWIML